MDMNTVWLMVLGAMAAAAMALARRRKNPSKTVVPVILRRRELQEQLAGLLSAEESARSLKAEATRCGRPSWDIVVLERCVNRALAAKSRAEREAQRSRSAVGGGSFTR